MFLVWNKAEMGRVRHLPKKGKKACDECRQQKVSTIPDLRGKCTNLCRPNVMSIWTRTSLVTGAANSRLRASYLMALRGSTSVSKNLRMSNTERNLVLTYTSQTPRGPGTRESSCANNCKILNRRILTLHPSPC